MVFLQRVMLFRLVLCCGIVGCPAVALAALPATAPSGPFAVNPFRVWHIGDVCHLDSTAYLHRTTSTSRPSAKSCTDTTDLDIHLSAREEILSLGPGYQPAKVVLTIGSFTEANDSVTINLLPGGKVITVEYQSNQLLGLDEFTPIASNAQIALQNLTDVPSPTRQLLLEQMAHENVQKAGTLWRSPLAAQTVALLRHMGWNTSAGNIAGSAKFNGLDTYASAWCLSVTSSLAVKNAANSTAQRDGSSVRMTESDEVTVLLPVAAGSVANFVGSSETRTTVRENRKTRERTTVSESRQCEVDRSGFKAAPTMAGMP